MNGPFAVDRAATRLLRAAQRLERVDSEAALIDGLEETLRDIGVDYWIYLTVAGDGGEPILLSNIDVHDGDRDVFDPFLDYCCEGYETTRTGIEYLGDHPYLDDRARAFIERAGAMGFRSGHAIPVRLVGSPVYGGFNLGTGLSRDEFERAMAPLAEPLRAFCLIVHRRIEELARADQPGAAEEKDGPLSELTAREGDVLAALTGGASRRAIADHLGVSEHTIASHTRSIYQKLQVANRVEAARVAMAAGLEATVLKEPA